MCIRLLAHILHAGYLREVPKFPNRFSITLKLSSNLKQLPLGLRWHRLLEALVSAKNLPLPDRYEGCSMPSLIVTLTS